MRDSLALPTLALLLSAPVASAQSTVTWRVDDDGGPNVDFLEIQPAIDAAAPGDRILVEAGVYASRVVVDKGVRLICADGIRLRQDGVGGAPVVVRDVPALDVAVVSGLDEHAIDVEQCAGTVVVDGGVVRPLGAAGVFLRSDDVVRVRDAADVRGRGRTLESAEDSRVEWVQARDGRQLTVTDGSFVHLVAARHVGRDGEDLQCPLCGSATDGEDAILSADSSLVLVRCELFGGDPGFDNFNPLLDGRPGSAVEACGGFVRKSETIAFPGSPSTYTALAYDMQCGAILSDPVPRIDPTLELVGDRRAGTMAEIRVAGTPGDSIRLLMGDTPAVVPVGESAIERLLVVDRDSPLGFLPATGEMLLPFPVRANWRAGDVVYLQIEATSPIGEVELSNSVPIVVRADFTTPGGIGDELCLPDVNSTGLPGQLAAFGSDVASDNDLRLHAYSLPPGATTLFLTSEAWAPALPLGQGRLCLGGSIGRYVGPGELQVADAIGDAELVVDLTRHPRPTGPVTVQAGETWHFQAWHRDVVGGASTSNLTDSLRITFR